MSRCFSIRIEVLEVFACTYLTLCVRLTFLYYQIVSNIENYSYDFTFVARSALCVGSHILILSVRMCVRKRNTFCEWNGVWKS